MKFWAALAASALVLGVGGLGTVAPATAASTDGAMSVSVAPDDLGALRAGEPLHLSLTIEDLSGTGLGAATATVMVDRTPVAARQDLAEWFASDSKNVHATTRVLETSTPPVLAGEARIVDLTVPASALRFGAAGVYPVTVVVANGSSTIGTARTAVVWLTAASSPVPVALAVPLTLPAGTDGLIDANTLEADTAPEGLLTLELDDVIGRQVAIGIDPRLIASIRILGKSAPQSARDWLDRLAAATNATFPLAWADADLTVALQAGAGTVPAVKPLDYAIDPSRFATPPDEGTDSGATPTPTPTPDPGNPALPTNESLVEWNYTFPTLAWPTENTVVKADLPKLAASGVGPLILSSENVSEASGAAGASSTIGTTKVAVSDAIVSKLLGDAMQAGSTAAWSQAMGRLSAAVAQLSVQSPNAPQAILATVPRGWSDNGIGFDRTLDALFERPWATSTTLGAILGGTPVAAKIVNRAQPDERVDRVRDMLAAQSREAQFSVVAKNPDQLISSRQLLFLSLLANGWLSDPTGWATAVDGFLGDSDDIVASVQVVNSSTVTFLNDQGSLPVTVSNAFDQPVTVYVLVRPRTTLLAVERNYRRVEVTVDAGAQRKVQIPVQSLANGLVQVRVFLHSADGRQVGATKVVNVNVQAGWETAGTLIFGALIIAIFGFGIVRNIRKRRKAARE